MVVDDLLKKLTKVRRSGQGWMACCPAHNDHSPSLSISQANDGRTLFHCFAGCGIEQICAALGLTSSDLFTDSNRHTKQRSQPLRDLPRIPSFDWRKHSQVLMLYSEDRYLHGNAVLINAKGLDISSWTSEELEIASNAVCDAIQDIDESERVADLAFNLRAYGLEEESERNRESQRRKASYLG